LDGVGVGEEGRGAPLGAKNQAPRGCLKMKKEVKA
jgi:hypothetical protein